MLAPLVPGILAQGGNDTVVENRRITTLAECGAQHKAWRQLVRLGSGEAHGWIMVTVQFGSATRENMIVVKMVGAKTTRIMLTT